MLFARKYISILSIVILIGLYASAQERDLRMYKSLKGEWRFSIGDKVEWRTHDFDHSQWEKINVPMAWEDQGFNGYDGYAWYRLSFHLSDAASEEELWLDLGYIDDVDECYLNGELIGSTGSFPPDKKTAYNSHRLYKLPMEQLIYGDKNVIAVRVYDFYNAGGIVSGNIGLLHNKRPLLLDLSLEGKWQFQTGDNHNYKNIDFKDNIWDSIYVPGAWEDQGYEYYDGIAWYRKSVSLSNELKGESLVLILGKIDDVDEVYVNGELIGQTGDIEPHHFIYDKAYQSMRGYIIPAHVLHKNDELVIAVRVYDARLTGGIYEGPVGIVTQDKYIHFWNKIRNEH